MIASLQTMKPRIADRLRVLLDRIDRDSPDVGVWRRDLFARLIDYATRGKMIRGALVSVGAKASFGGSLPGLLDEACAWLASSNATTRPPRLIEIELVVRVWRCNSWLIASSCCCIAR